MRKDGETARAWFADELKAHRAKRGWTQAELAERCHVSESLIAQVETMHKSATPELARALDRVFETPGFSEEPGSSEWTPGTFTRLVRRLRAMPFTASFEAFEPREAAATALYTFEHSFVPGIFQTREYARAVLEMHVDVTEEILSERLEGRLSRQAILTRDNPQPPVIVALIDQNVLLREIGGPKVMRDQLVHLADVSRQPNITLQVTPNAGAHLGLLGAFTVAEGPGGTSVLNIEDIASGRVTEDTDTVSTVTLRFHALRGDALSKSASRELIESVVSERWGDLK